MHCPTMLTAAVLAALLIVPVFTAIEPLPEIRLVAGIPYGSISGRVAEYFATQRSTIVNGNKDKDEDEKSDDSLNSLNSDSSQDLDLLN